MADRILSNQKGLALLITVTTLSLLVALTVQFHKTTWHKFLVSHNYKVKSQLHAAAVSGVNIGAAVLEADGKAADADTLLDQWAVFSEEDFTGLFSSASLELHVTDLAGKIQVNSLVPKAGGGDKNDENPAEVLQDALVALMFSGGFPIEDEEEAQAIVDALVDWVDEDDRESGQGAESSYYQSLDRPYSCRNGPIQYIEELLLVKGITPELFYGKAEEGGLINFLTVYGDDGKININTAQPLLVQSLDGAITKEILEAFKEYREDTDKEEELSSVSWYTNVDGWPGDIVLNEKIIAVQSSYFQVESIGFLDSRTRRLVVDLQRTEGGDVVVLRKSVK